MSDLILGLAGVIQKDINRLASVAQNAANANTVGYKAVQEFAALAGVEPGTPAGPALERLGTDTYLRERDGALRPTGRNTDLALAGKAWFVVDTPQGARLTRDGRFHVNADGVLVNTRGYAVVGEGGALRVGEPAFAVDREGRVSVAGEERGRLVLVVPQTAASLRPDGEGLYLATGALGAATEFSLHQGMLEQSNVDLGADMVRMMETSRHIESVQRALSAYNEVLGTGIGQLGKD